jgi:hypothetical protein
MNGNISNKRTTGATLSQESLAPACTDAAQEERKRKFLQENKAAIDAYNSRVRKHGMWNKSLRMF